MTEIHYGHGYTPDVDFLTSCFDQLPDKLERKTPVEWAESERYLPDSVTPIPGIFSFDVNPVMKEPLACMGMDHECREVTIVKGVQVGATVCVIENLIGYLITQLRTSPALLFTADQDLAGARLENNILPMIEHSGLTDRLQSLDNVNRRKTGKTKKQLSWVGGGWLRLFGAVNPSNFRSHSGLYVLLDEIDAWAMTVGRDGDPVKLAEYRAQAFYSLRKIVRISTPTLVGQSKVWDYYRQGDRRQYNVPCPRCGEFDVLRFQNRANEHKYGFVWELDADEKLIPESVEYVCRLCGGLIQNAERSLIMQEGEWRPTAVADKKYARSYDIPSWYSPASMFPWSGIVADYLEAFDANNNVRDHGKAQTFYNNHMARPWEEKGRRIQFQEVSSHRRTEYTFGTVPNKYAEKYAGSKILLVTIAVDVHKSNLAVAVVGWCVDGRSFLIDYTRIPATDEDMGCENPEDGAWRVLETDYIEQRWTADDGTVYGSAMTFVDAGKYTETVYGFCAQYETSVYPIFGREILAKRSVVKEFNVASNTVGTPTVSIAVDLFKDRWASILRREWSGDGTQPPDHFNAPADATDAQLRELTREVKRETLTDDGHHKKFVWHRPRHAQQELWDLLVYSRCALYLVCWSYCTEVEELETADWPFFWGAAAENELYMNPEIE